MAEAETVSPKLLSTDKSLILRIGLVDARPFSLKMSSSERKKKVATGGRGGEARVRTEGGGDKKKMPPARVWGEGVKGKVRGRAKAGLARLTITGCSGGGKSVAEKRGRKRDEWRAGGESTW